MTEQDVLQAYEQHGFRTYEADSSVFEGALTQGFVREFADGSWIAVCTHLPGEGVIRPQSLDEPVYIGEYCAAIGMIANLSVRSSAEVFEIATHLERFVDKIVELTQSGELTEEVMSQMQAMAIGMLTNNGARVGSSFSGPLPPMPKEVS